MSRSAQTLAAQTLAVTVALFLAACDDRGEGIEALMPEGELTAVGSTDAGVIQAPNGSMSVAVRQDGDATLMLSAGFLRRAPVTAVALPVEISWSPDSRRFLVNERGGLRLWNIDRRGTPVESEAAREAAVQALARRNGCGPLPSDAVETRGTAWGDDGRVVFVTVRGLPGPGPCAFARVSELSLAIDADSGRLEAAPDVTRP